MLPDWPEKSAQFLKAHPICQNRGTAPSTETHHKIPRRLGGTDNEDNLMAVCSKCHKKLDNEIMLRERMKKGIINKRAKRKVLISEAIQFELPLEYG